MSFSNWLVDENRGFSLPIQQQANDFLDGIPVTGPYGKIYQKDMFFFLNEGCP